MNITVLRTKLGYDDHCQPVARLYLRVGSREFRIVQFEPSMVFQLLNAIDLPDWESLTGVTCRYESNENSTGRLGHLVRDTWFQVEERNE